ncbi:MAG: DUF2065 domain-containing protein [Beijerinckiaceae bacterium]
MRDFGVAIGLVFAIEGLLIAAFPRFMRQSMLETAARPEHWLRAAGLIAAVAGVGVIWLVRSFLS